MTLRLAVGVLAATLLVLCLASHPAFAQISPGPLARPHADLDRASDCLKCHMRGEEMSVRCMSCHTEIRASREGRRGFHGLEATGACESCHPDHAGRDFVLIQWKGGSEKAFDHAQAGWTLEGKHAGLECRSCHQPKFQQAERIAPVKIKDHTKTWMGLDTRCNACHEDPHKKRFGEECTKCHDARDWKTMHKGSFDHDLTRWPLRGRHARLECAACHDPQKAWGEKPRFAACGDCHADAHAGQALLAGKPADCAACHDERGFTPSTMAVSAHAKTSYKLEGRHRTVKCAACHVKATGAAAAKLGRAAVVMRPSHAACASCHADAHGGQLGKKAADAACDRCHDLRGFRPSRFTVADHRSTPFALVGAHASADCRSCHGAKRKGLPRPAAASKAGRAGFVFALAERDCAQCHADVHAGKLARYAKGGTCLSCHDTKRFSPSRVSPAMHDAYGFALEGAHLAVPCVGCHGELRSAARGADLALASSTKKPLTFEHKDHACASCHKNPHGDQFATRRGKGACETCHDTERFRPASRFDHDRDAHFKLEGAHAKAACIDCHRPPARGRGPIVYKGTPRECTACHETGSPKGRKASAGSNAVTVSNETAMLVTVHGGPIKGGS